MARGALLCHLACRCATAAALLLGLGACASTPPPAPSLDASSGAQLYQQLCASCHGIEGRGDGPIAPLIRIGVPDLTQMARRNGGEFPDEAARRTIDGRADRRAHGARDMPVWGWRFYASTEENDPAARARSDRLIAQLVDYLESIQR